MLWATQAAAAPWLAATGLATDPQGFIAVNRYLQSCSHPQVFAAGDVATMLEQPRPKAGVFAVRQGRPLADNLRAAILGQPLKPFKAQKQFLSLINLANGQAIATRGNWTFTGAWAWVWKDYIDRKFMRQFQ
jgi:selenide,water dikinase